MLVMTNPDKEHRTTEKNMKLCCNKCKVKLEGEDTINYMKREHKTQTQTKKGENRKRNKNDQNRKLGNLSEIL